MNTTVREGVTPMFLALRDIRFATGRFTLMGGVVALISLLLVMLSGLTAGLANQNTSAIDSLDADTLVFSVEAEQDPSFTESQVTEDQLAAWQQAEGVGSAEPLGITQTRAEPGGETGGATSAAVFGAETDGELAPSSVADGEAVISEEIAEELGISTGETINLGGAEMTVTETIQDQWYSHTPVVWTTQQDWTELAHLSDQEVVGTVIAASHADGQGTDGEGMAADGAAGDGTAADGALDDDEIREAADASAGTQGMTPEDSFSALEAYASENASLMLIQGLLYGISALVIIAFLTVWTVQRTRDIAVLKALGASERYVLRDALSQALIVLSGGALVGGLLGLGGGALATQAAPFEVTASTTVVPVVGVIVLGLLGATLAVRRSTRVDPLIALGGT